MKHRRIILALILGILLVSVILISAATGQGGIGGQAPAYKVAFELTQRTLQADRSKLPAAPKSSEVKLSTSCPDLSFKPGIFDFRIGPFPQGNLFINTAGIIVKETEYYIFAGALRNAGLPAEILAPILGDPAPAFAGTLDDMTHAGLLRVVGNPVDACAASLKGINGFTQDYLYPRGPIRITQIEGDIVVFSIAGGDTGRFHVISGQFTP